MPSSRIAAAVLAAVVTLVSCNRDPNVAKRRYLESGNKYFEKGRYKEARIRYKNALQKDMRFGPAYYKLGLTEMKLGQTLPAVNAFRRAVELLPHDQPDYWDAMVELSEIYLFAGREQKQLMDEVEGYTREILKRDPNSFDGHRLTGDLNFARGLNAYKVARKDEGDAYIEKAVAEYRIADGIKPAQEGVMMQLARALVIRTDYPNAEQLYRQVIDKNKTLIAAYTELFRLYVFQKKMSEAEQVLKLGYQNNPKQLEFLTTLALHYSMQRRTADMVSVLDQIKAHAADFQDAYFVVGDFYLRLGDGDAAAKEYDEGMVRDPKRKLAYQKRKIEVLMHQGKKTEAADLNSQILKQNPNDPESRGLAATFLLDSGDVNRAILDLQSVVTAAPDNAIARFNLGRAHAARGELEQARQSFQKAIELRPDYLPPRLALAEVQVERGEFEASIKTADGVLQIDRGNFTARLLQSAALLGEKKYADARVMLDQMLKVIPNSPDVYFQLGMVNLAEARYKEAEDTFRKTYELNPANARGLLGIVQTLLAQNKTDQAVQILQSETEKAPNRLEFRLALARTSVQLGKYDMAIAEYQKVLDALDKNSKIRGQIYMEVGATYRRKGDDSNAVVNMQKAREIVPENVQVLTELAVTLEHAGKIPEAKQVYEAAIKLDPNNGVALNNLAFLLAEHNGDLDEALSKAQRAKQLMPNTAEVSDTLGEIFLRKNMSDNAIGIFEDLVAKTPKQSTYRYHLALALKQKGDKPRAVRELNEALKYNPGKEERAKIQEELSHLNGG